MAERAHPEDPGFKDKWFGLVKNKYKKNLFDRYAFCNGYIADKVVLEIPCGVGWGTSLLKGYKHITALDISEEAIRYAKSSFGNKNICFKVGDMTKLSFNDNYFDVVVCLEGYEHVTKDVGLCFIKEAKRVLKDDGKLIMTVPLITDGKHSGNPYHLYEPTLTEIQEILTADFLYTRFEIIKGPESDIAWFVGTPK